MRKEWERRGPLYLGLIVASIAAAAGPFFFSFAIAKHWDFQTLYSATFDVAAMSAALLFAFYTFAKTSDSLFFNKVRTTESYRSFMDYLVVAVFLATFLTLISIPMMIVTPSPSAYFSPSYWSVVVWSFFVGVALGATWRSVRQFMAFTVADATAAGK